MTWKGRNVFVTGGNGFLGSLLVQHLLDRGAKVSCLLKEDRPLSRFHMEGTVSRVTCIRGGVEDIELLRGAVREVDAVFHLAAQPIVMEAQANPLSVFETNVRGTYNVLEACRSANNLRALIVTTSDKVYGEAECLPYVETDRLSGIAPYEVSKVCADVLAQSYAKNFGLPVGVARMGNLYGPGDVQWSRIVPGTIRSLLKGERPIIRSDGKMERDYFFVGDAVEALLVLGEALRRSGHLAQPDIRGEAFNFGTEIPTSVIDVVRVIVRRSSVEVEPIVQNQARGEISAQYLDCSKAKRLLGWEHKVSLDIGLDCTWSWYEKVFRGRL